MSVKVDKKILYDLKNWFISYVNTFRSDDHRSQQNIDIKKAHSERVVEEIINIGEQIGLTENELNLAQIIALFHDIGRFEQFEKYKTFSDSRSENHAEMGVRILKKYNILGELNEESRKVVYCSILNHNKITLPLDGTKTCLFYSALIRDADKLDIWRVVTDYYNDKNGRRNITLELELPDTAGISQKVFKSLMNKEIVSIRDIQNINDIKLLQAGWIYDINFKPTFECIIKRKYLESLQNTLPGIKEIKDIFAMIGSYIENHEISFFPEKYMNKDTEQ